MASSGTGSKGDLDFCTTGSGDSRGQCTLSNSKTGNGDSRSQCTLSNSKTGSGDSRSQCTLSNSKTGSGDSRSQCTLSNSKTGSGDSRGQCTLSNSKTGSGDSKSQCTLSNSKHWLTTSLVEGVGKQCSECGTLSHSEHRFPAPSSRLPDLVTPLKGHSLSSRSCPATRSAPSERFGY